LTSPGKASTPACGWAKMSRRHDCHPHRPGHAHGGGRRPAYFAKREQPQTPRDLTAHACNNLRLPTNGGLYTWEFEKDGESLKVRVSGQVTLNGVYPLLDAALDGFGLSYIPENIVAPYLADGRLLQVLADWCPTFAGYHLYYPSRRQAAPAFALLVEALRYRGQAPIPAAQSTDAAAHR
jgi:DNA-binding transcriptional LysR family regulator